MSNISFDKFLYLKLLCIVVTSVIIQHACISTDKDELCENEHLLACCIVYFGFSALTRLGVLKSIWPVKIKIE